MTNFRAAGSALLGDDFSDDMFADNRQKAQQPQPLL
jgi:hypothetical protein